MEANESTAVVLVDAGGVIRYWSPGADALFGIVQPVGDTLDVIVPQEFRERHWAGFRRAMATGETRIAGAGWNLPVRCADGEVHSFPGTFMLVRDSRQQPIGAIAAWSQRRGDEKPFSPVSSPD